MHILAEKDQVFRLFQMAIEEVRPGYARIRMPFLDCMKNGWGALHGGVICTLADIAFGAAAQEGQPTFVVSLSSAIEFLRPGKVGPFTGEAKLVRQGNTISNFDVQVRDGEGKLIARSMASGFRTDMPAD